jgi:hypothetical protein
MKWVKLISEIPEVAKGMTINNFDTLADYSSPE